MFGVPQGKEHTVALKKVRQLQTTEMKLLMIPDSHLFIPLDCGLGPRQLTDGLEARIQLKTFLWLIDRPTKSLLLLCECFRRGKRTPLLNIRYNAEQMCVSSRHPSTMLEQKLPLRHAVSGQYHGKFWD